MVRKKKKKGRETEEQLCIYQWNMGVNFSCCKLQHEPCMRIKRVIKDMFLLCCLSIGVDKQSVLSSKASLVFPLFLSLPSFLGEKYLPQTLVRFTIHVQVRGRQKATSRLIRQQKHLAFSHSVNTK